MKFFLAFAVLVAVTQAASPRYGAASVEYEKKVYFTGGVLTQPFVFPDFPCDNFEHVYNDLNVYDAVPGEFEETPSPSFRTPRAFHSAVVYDAYIYLFGGAGDNNDIEVFDILSNEWFVEEVEGIRPSGRYAHAAAVFGNKMYISGGIDAENNETLADLWAFDFDTATWTEITGHLVAARAGHSLTADNRGYLWLFGGFADWKEGPFYNDVWIFDTVFGYWINVSPPPDFSPAPRAFHTAGLYSGGILIYGGMTREEPRGYDNEVEPFDADFFDDFWVVSLVDTDTPFPEAAAWIQVFVPSHKAKPLARGAHTSVVILDIRGGDEMIIFGGAHDDRETLADIWTYDLSWGNGWVQLHCYPGYEYPHCTLNCRDSNYCNGHGTCLGNGECHCHEGWLGETCDYNYCDGYRGFGYKQLNEILLPKSLEAIYIKLDVIKAKLAIIEELIPSVDCDNFVGDYAEALEEMAEKSYAFYQHCLVDNLLETTTGFETAIGCDEPCGSETWCVEGDVCINGECRLGEARNCSTANPCWKAWCDEEEDICRGEWLVCDDLDPCTIDSCNNQTGTCEFVDIDCDDGSCCTFDACLDGECLHEDKCTDYNFCTIESCSEDCSLATCTYEYDPCCFMNVGQEAATGPLGPENHHTPLGSPIELLPEKVVPPQSSGDRGDAWFWLDCCQKVLHYDIRLDLENEETGAHIFGPVAEPPNAKRCAGNKKCEDWVPSQHVAGVRYTLPLGDHKTGAWSFQSDDLCEDLKNGLYYVQIFSKEGDIRGQIEFNTDI